MQISKKIITLLVIVLLLSSCSSSQQNDNSENNQKTAVKVEKKLLNKEVTISKEFLNLSEDQDPQKIIDKLVAEKRIKSGKVNPDGSVTYYLSATQHKEFLLDLKNGVEASIKELINDPSNSITDIKFNDSCSIFDVYVDPNSYSDFESLIALAFYLEGGFYRMFNGDSEIDVVVNFINKDTNEIINTTNSKDLGKSENTEAEE